jgi:DNA-binding NarL/FixJ family response regulator
MCTIQLALSDGDKASALSMMLSRSTHVPVLCVETPDFTSACVVVMDGDRFAREPAAALNADRVVLITRNDEGHLHAAWEAGVNSVLSDQDPMNTVVLAVLSACLRVTTMKQKQQGSRPT